MGTYANYYADKLDKNTGKYQKLPVDLFILPEQNYLLFNILANIREIEGTKIPPIPHNKGLPADLCEEINDGESDDAFGYFFEPDLKYHHIDELAPIQYGETFGYWFYSQDILDYYQNQLKQSLALIACRQACFNESVELRILNSSFFSHIEKWQQRYGDFRFFIIID